MNQTELTQLPSEPVGPVAAFAFVCELAMLALLVWVGVRAGWPTRLD